MRVLRSGLTLFGIVAIAASCEDLGLPGENIPLEVARTAPPKPLEAESVRLEPVPVPGIPEGGISIGDQAFVATATEYDLGDGDVTAVGAAGGATIFAMRWDSAPYDYLLARLPSGRYARLDPVRTIPGPASGPTHEAAGAVAAPDDAGH